MVTPYHAGVVVDDIERAIEDLSDRFGYTFNPPTSLAIPVLDDRVTGRTHSVDLVASYTREGPFRLEVIQAQGSGVYSADLAGLHHLGVWEHDPQSRLDELEAAGDPVDAVIRRADGAISAIYCRPRLVHARIEYVNDDRRPQLEQWFEAGTTPTQQPK